jgi:hypothetical protein
MKFEFNWYTIKLDTVAATETNMIRNIINVSRFWRNISITRCITIVNTGRHLPWRWISKGTCISISFVELC